MANGANCSTFFAKLSNMISLHWSDCVGQADWHLCHTAAECFIRKPTHPHIVTGFCVSKPNKAS